MSRILVVRHETTQPALYGAAAALIAARIGARVVWPHAQFDEHRHPDAVQHIAAAGARIPSGLIWADRLTGQGALPLAEYTGQCTAVVPWHPAFLAKDAERAIMQCLAAGAEQTVIEQHDNAFFTSAREIIGWRDRFGRVVREPPETRPSGGVVFAIAASAQQCLDICPAPLAALGDAIDTDAAGGLVRFLDPHALPTKPLAGVDGVLLPGGAQMSAVPGQIALARAARAQGIPVLGLCLGMQSMATAIAWELPGWEDAHLAEAAPHAPRHSFIRIETGEYRLGLDTTRPVPGSRMARILGTHTQMAYNHRYRLNPALHPALASRGVHVCALGGARGQDIADAIEAEQGFYMGMQGHPELASRAGHPHPLIRAFVEYSTIAPNASAAIPSRPAG